MASKFPTFSNWEASPDIYQELGSIEIFEFGFNIAKVLEILEGETFLGYLDLHLHFGGNWICDGIGKVTLLVLPGYE